MPEMNALSESLMTNALDLIGGSTMAQQFLEHMDFYSTSGMSDNTTIDHTHPAQTFPQQELRQHQQQMQHQSQQLPNVMQHHQQQQLEFMFQQPRQSPSSSSSSLLQQHTHSNQNESCSSSSSSHSLNSTHLYGQLYKNQNHPKLQHAAASSDATAIVPPATSTSPTGGIHSQYERYHHQLHNQQQMQHHSLTPSPTNSNGNSNNNNNKIIINKHHHHHHHLHKNSNNNNNNHILDNNLYHSSQHLSNLNLQMESQQQQATAQTLAQSVANVTGAAAVAAAAAAATAATNSLNNVNHNNSSSNSSNSNNNNNNSTTNTNGQANNILLTNNNGSAPSNLISSTSAVTASSATSALAANNQQQQHLQQQSQSQTQSQSQQVPTAPHQQQHQHHHHHHQHQHQQHQHVAGSTSPYKSCWCFGESVCSGLEIEIENNNNHYHYGDTTYHMKILVPAVASGAIIGKGGETIASLQKDTGARVKMSKSHDFYPGTTERVCLITGTIDGIMAVLDFVMDKIREKPDLTSKIMDTENKQSQERDKQVKILVPNSTAGMIIGKGGAYIKQVKEESGSYVQISQKPKDISLQERCITIIGDKENNKNACKMILSKIVEDPQSGTCLNVSYADINGPVANFNPTGSPYATNQNAINSSTASLNSTLGASIGGAASAAGLLVNGTGINLSLNLSSPNPAPNLALAQQLLEHIKIALRNSGYSETATTEVCAALGVLAKYGVLGMGVGLPHANGAHTAIGSYLGVSALEQQTAAANAAANAANNVFGAVGQVNLDQYTAAAAAAAAAANRPQQSQLDAAATQFDPFRHLGTTGQAATPVSLNNNSFGLTAATGTATQAPSLGAATGAHGLGGLSKSPTPGDMGPKDTKNVEIPEVIVGAILGPNGRCLVEIQHISGANVQISKKGIFAPGTRNRIVTITGQPNAIAKAQFLIEQKINEEETKRARQIPLATVVN